MMLACISQRATARSVSEDDVVEVGLDRVRGTPFREMGRRNFEADKGGGAVMVIDENA